MSVLNQSGDEAVECPLCMEPLEVDDLNFFPCTCGYQICRFCWHRIRTDENGLCPACRKAYSENPADFKPLTKEEISRLKAEKRLKDQQRKQRVTENRKHLANVRVVQKNLVFVVGLPMRLADADVLKRHEYFGKFGKIHKVVINQSTSYAGSQGPSASAYVTYQRQEDALRAIEAVNNIAVDGRTIKTSLGTTKYCSHFMRNQSCPKPDCMYLHDLGDQEASFTKEEMHQGKHQDYERKLVQSNHAHASTAQRKPTPSPPVTGTAVRENGTVTSQIKEAWPSLQPGQQNSSSAPNSKESSPLTSASQQQTPVSLSNGNSSNPSNISSCSSQQNNNNKGELGSATSRRGKSNSESKAQAARNKHKNNQNKEKHGTQNTGNSTVVGIPGTRTTSRSESSSTSSSQSSVPGQSHSQKEIRCFNEGVDTSKVRRQNGSCKIDDNSRQIQQGNSQLEIDIDDDKMSEMKINGAIMANRPRNGERSQSESESDNPREGSTPASTVSSSEESSSASANQHTERRSCVGLEEQHLIDESNVSSLNSSQATKTNGGINTHQIPPPGLHACPTNNITNGSLMQQMQLNHRSIFPTDNNSFFSSNSFQKVSNVIAMPTNSQTGSANLDWTNTCLAPIPDSLPSVHSSEDWQAAFGFQTEKCRAASNRQANKKPTVVDFLDIDENTFYSDDDCRENSTTKETRQMPHDLNHQTDETIKTDFLDYAPDDFYTEIPSKSRRATSPTKDTRQNVCRDAKRHVNTAATKFMADFQQNSLQQRLAMQSQQNQENCEYIKQNGHGGVEVTSGTTVSNSAEIKPDDDLGFDPFHETQKALAELMENEMQLQQQRIFQQQQQQQQQHHHQQQQQQQQQQQRDREEQNRIQQQGLAALGPQHFTQVAHLAHLQQQATHLQNLHVLHQSHSLLSRLPQNLIQQQQQQSAGGQNGAGQQAPPMTSNSLGQRSRLPPPGFPGSTPNHMNSFGLGIPRPAPTNNPLAAAPPSQQVAYLPNGSPLLASQGVNKCAADAVYSLKDWCEINGQQQQQFHHQPLHQKGGWNNFGPIADWTSIDPAIVSSSRPLSFQAASTWQFSRAHPSHSVPHNAQQEQNAPAQHWAMQPPPGFGGPSITTQINSQQGNTVAQPHTSTKLISAGSEIENM